LSVIKRKSSIALVAGVIVVLLFIPVWYAMLVPSVVASELEKIDMITSYKGTFGKAGYMGTYPVINRSGVWEIPICIIAHLCAIEVKGDNVVLRLDVNIVRNDTGETLPPPFSTNSTYVFDKFTLENVKDCPDANKPREGYDPLYPSHLEAGEDIPDVWLDTLNETATLRFEGSVVEEDVTLYKYFVNKTINKTLWIEDLKLFRNCTLTSTKTVLIEPLSGILAYAENETFDWFYTHGSTRIPLVYFTYESTAEAKADGIATAKEAHDGLQLLELYIPIFLGVVAIMLTTALAFNVRRLKRKGAPKSKT
jgi:hypothetical protein